MKKYSFLLVALAGAFLFSVQQAQAQFTKAPDEVKQAFTQKYPNATEVDYTNKVVETDVTFKDDGANCVAKFSNKGEWQATSKEIQFESLPDQVQDGFNKSKYSDWKVDNTYEIYQPDKDMEYKVVVEKSSVQKKNLFFNLRGRMLHDNLTI
jgi:Putative beta-lactamase-inhibitor-like, PepSY-like